MAEFVCVCVCVCVLSPSKKLQLRSEWWNYWVSFQKVSSPLAEFSQIIHSPGPLSILKMEPLPYNFSKSDKKIIYLFTFFMQNRQRSLLFVYWLLQKKK